MRKVRHQKKKLIATILTLTATLLVFKLFVLKGPKININDAGAPFTSEKSDSTQQRPKVTRIIATGDFIAHDALNVQAKNPDGSYSYSSFIDQMKPVLNVADIRFCNQSTLVGGEQFPVTGFPSFNAPKAFASDMLGVGCNVINMASNHSSDKTQAVINANVDLWASLSPLAAAGQNRSEAEKQMVHFFTIDGLKYAFLAYTTYSNSANPSSYGVNMYSRGFATTQIDAAKQAGAQFIIVSMRWGTEYSGSVNSFQTIESQFLADQGVKLILGHGPHVVEPVKKLTGTGGNETIVWYSLGNFLHAQLEAETLFNGVAVMSIDPKTASITSLGFLPTYMHYDWTANEAARQDLLARKNFELVPIEKANNLFKSSQLKTTIEAQQQRLQSTLNTYTAVTMLSLKDIGL